MPLLNQYTRTVGPIARMPSPTASSVGRRIREARERLGLTQGDVANMLGKTATAVSYWEGGQRSPGLEDLVEIASVLRINAVELLPSQPPRVVARAHAELLAIEHLADAVDRVLDRFDEPTSVDRVPRAPSSNPAETAGFARRHADQRRP